VTSPLDTACPLCGAAPWVSCRGRVIPVTRSPHVERIVASQHGTQHEVAV